MKLPIRALILQTLQELKHRKMPWVLAAMLFLFWSPISVQIFFSQQFSQINPKSILGLSEWLFHVVVFGGIVTSSIYASKLIENDITQRVISAVLVRPIARSTYILSRALGTSILFLLFMFVAIFSNV